LFDELDPVGPMVVTQWDTFVGKALLRKDGKWQFVDATTHAREISLHDGIQATAHPMGTLDVPSLASITGAPNVRFDLVMGKSIGSHKGLSASHDLYIDIEGTLLSGKIGKLRTTITAPQGQSYLTALNVFLLFEGIFGLAGQSIPTKGGLHTPETLLDVDTSLSRFKEFGIVFSQEEVK